MQNYDTHIVLLPIKTEALEAVTRKGRRVYHNPASSKASFFILRRL